MPEQVNTGSDAVRRASERPGPLAGVRVVDLSRILAGPYCTMVLGDLGAEIIKIESPDGGDSVRGIAPYYDGGESHYFMSLNRNKRSVVIDMKSDEGRSLVLGLVRESDIVVENFRSGVMERLGLGFEVLAEANPSVILCSISGYGAGGSWSTRSAFDLVAQARSGAMSVNGDPAGPPMKLGLPLGDLSAGLWATVAIVTALQDRHRGGGPQHIDISMLDGLMGLLGYIGQLSLLTGESPPRVGNTHHSVVPYGCYPTKDGHIALALLVDRFWQQFCRAVGRDELLEDERFASPDSRLQHRRETEDVVQEILKERTRDEWMQLFDEWDVPASPILDVEEALRQEPVVERGVVQTVRHPTAGDVQYVRTPIRHVGQEAPPASSPPPLYGEHTQQVLQDVLGVDDQRLRQLLDSGVLRGQ